MIGIINKNFRQDRLAEVAEKDEVIILRNNIITMYIMNDITFNVFSQYIGLDEFLNTEMQALLVLDEDLQKTVDSFSDRILQFSMPALSRFTFMYGDTNDKISIIQGHYAHTKTTNQYEIGIFYNNKWMNCQQFNKLELPDNINTGDYGDGLCDCENCSSQIIPYSEFEELIEYIYALAKFAKHDFITKKIEF